MTSSSARPNISMSAPDIGVDEIALVNEVLRSPNLSGGPMVAAFEQEWIDRLGGDHAVAVSSGTSGLHLSLLAAGVRGGDVVITSSFSFVASANVAIHARAVPIFVDIDPVTLNVDPAIVEDAADAFVHRRPETRRWTPRMVPPELAGDERLGAILPVHVFGQPADMRPLLATADRLGVPVIEDACEAVGATYDGRFTGTMGSAAVFAFYPNKQVTTGEGGMVVTQRGDWAGLIRSLRNQGRDNDATWLRHVRLGYNYRLNDMSAALGLAQLRRLDVLLTSRAAIASGYEERLASVEGVTLPQLAPTTTRMSWFVFVIRLAADIDRDLVMAKLQADGIPSRPYFSPIHLQPIYREMFGYREGDLPHTEAAGRSCLALPFHSRLSSGDLDFMASRLKVAISRSRASQSSRIALSDTRELA